jgi:Zn-dependent M28 family amino/carboxypeptidase
MAEAVEQLEGYLNDLFQASNIVANGNGDESLRPAISAVIYAQSQVDIPELALVKGDLMRSRAGRDLSANSVDSKFALKLAMRTPDDALVDRYLGTIADSFGLAIKSPSSVNETTTATSPPPYSSTSIQTTATMPGFDEITRRFEQLKKRP